MDSAWEKYRPREPELAQDEKQFPMSEDWETCITEIDDTFEYIKKDFIRQYNSQTGGGHRVIKNDLRFLLHTEGVRFYTIYPLARKFITEKLKEDLSPIFSGLKKKPPTEPDLKIAQALLDRIGEEL